MKEFNDKEQNKLQKIGLSIRQSKKLIKIMSKIYNELPHNDKVFLINNTNNDDRSDLFSNVENFSAEGQEVIKKYEEQLEALQK